MRDKYLYVINNVLEGYDREAVENHVEELEQQKVELIQLLKEIDENVLTEWPYEYLYYRNRVAEIINK